MPNWMLENSAAATTNLPTTFMAPLGVDLGSMGGSRARGYDSIIHEDDGRPQGSLYTLEGVLYGSDFSSVTAQMDILAPAVKGAVKLWFAGRYYKVLGGLIAPPTYRSPVLNSFNLSIVFRLADVRRFNSDGSIAPW